MDTEKECRVCREDEDTEENPLYAPCLCSGSILFCHETCLVEWLKRSGKDYCELCNTKYVFQPKYAADTPDVLPNSEVLRGALRMTATRFFPQMLRLTIALIAWLIVMPCVTSAVYRALVFSHLPAHSYSYSLSNTTVADESMYNITGSFWGNYLYFNSVSGLLLTGLIVVTFIIMMSFGDFLRSYWTLTNNNRQPLQQPQLQRQEVDQQDRQDAQHPQQQRQQEELQDRQNAVRLDYIRRIRAEDRRARFQVNENEGGVEEHRDFNHRANLNFNNDELGMDRVGALPIPRLNDRLPAEYGHHDSISDATDSHSKNAVSPQYTSSDLDMVDEKVSSARDEKNNSLEDDFFRKILDPQESHSKESGDLTEQLVYEMQWAEKERNCDSLEHCDLEGRLSQDAKGATSPKVDHPKEFFDCDNSNNSSNQDETFDDIDSSDSDDNYEGLEHVEVDVENEDQEEGAIDGILQVLGLNDLQMELEMEMEMGGGVLLDDEAQEEERLRVLQAEEQRLNQARNRQEDARLFDMLLQQERAEEINEGDNIEHAGGDRNVPDVLPILPELPAENEAELGGDGDGLGGARGGGVGAGDNGMELRLNVVELLGLAGPITGVFRSVSWMLLFNSVCIFVGYSVPSLFGSLITSNPLKLLYRLATLGQGDFVVFMASGGKWESFSMLLDGVSSSFASFINVFEAYTPVLAGEGGWVAAWKVWSLHMYERASATQSLINIPDLLIICTGYSVFVIDTIFLSIVAKFVSSRFSRGGELRRFHRKLSLLLDFVTIVVDVVKIGILLGVRIFVLPCIIGIFIYSCWNFFLFRYDSDILINFCVDNVIGAVSVLWGMGISFMLYSTIAILQLREILHPNFLARFIRPQESQSDLLMSLLQDSSPTQVKRLLISFLVYLLLIGAFIYIPLLLIHTFGGGIFDFFSPFGPEWSSSRVGTLISEVLAFRTHYLAPEFQIPLEVGILHTSFLMSLEKFKDSIGTMEFHTLVYLSKKLGLNRFLLPYTYRKIAVLNENIKSFEDMSPAIKEIYSGREILVIEGALVVVSEDPMLRPPAGWDARVRDSTTRWAWNEDAMYPLEKSVLPNVLPDNSCVVSEEDDVAQEKMKTWSSSAFLRRWGKICFKHPGFAIRFALLVIICWALSVTVSIVPALLPFAMGRVIFFAFRLPDFCCHDPLAYFVGNYVMQRMIQGLENMQESMYGRLCRLMWSWKTQRYLPPSPSEDDVTKKSRISPGINAPLQTVRSLAWQLFLTCSIGFFFLPLIIGLAFNASIMFSPISFTVTMRSSFGLNVIGTSAALSAVESMSPSLTLNSGTLWNVVLGSTSENAIVLISELTRALIFGQIVLFIFVVSVLSGRMKKAFAFLGISVLPDALDGPLSPAELERIASGYNYRANHWLMRWYIIFWNDTPFADSLKQFEWEVDLFVAAFVRSSPDTVIQDHLATPRPERTTVTTLDSATVVHHVVEVIRKFNKCFLLAPQTCWFVQYVLGGYMFAIIPPFALRLYFYSLTSQSTCAGTESFAIFLLTENYIIIPLCMFGALTSWLDNNISVAEHIQRGWTNLVKYVQKSVKDDSYLIGKELQNSVEGLKHIAKLQENELTNND